MPPATSETRARKNTYEVAAGAIEENVRLNDQQRPMKALTNNGYPAWLPAARSGDHARFARSGLARNRARKFHMAQASQSPLGFASQTTAIAAVTIPTVRTTAAARKSSAGARRRAGAA